MNELPVVQGLIVCEQAVVDARTRNVSFINRFTIARVDAFPSQPRTVCVFASLTNGFGEHAFRVELESLDADEVVYHFQRTIQFSDRLQDVPVLLTVNDLVFPHEGAYQFSLFVGDEPLTRYRFQVVSRFRSMP